MHFEERDTIMMHQGVTQELKTLSWYQTDERAAIPFQRLDSARYPISLGLFELADKTIVRDTLLDCIKINVATKQLKKNYQKHFQSMMSSDDSTHSTDLTLRHDFETWLQPWQTLAHKIQSHQPTGWRKYLFFWRTLEVARYQSVLDQRKHQQIKMQIEGLFQKINAWLKSELFLSLDLMPHHFDKITQSLNHLSGFLMLHTNAQNLALFKQKENALETTLQQVKFTWLKKCVQASVDAYEAGNFETAHKKAKTVLSFQPDNDLFKDIFAMVAAQLDYEKHFQENEIMLPQVKINAAYLKARIGFLVKHQRKHEIIALSYQIKKLFLSEQYPALYFELLKALSEIRTLTTEEHILYLNLAQKFGQKEIAIETLNILQELEPENRHWLEQKKLLQGSLQVFFKKIEKDNISASQSYSPQNQI